MKNVIVQHFKISSNILKSKCSQFLISLESFCVLIQILVYFLYSPTARNVTLYLLVFIVNKLFATVTNVGVQVVSLRR